MTDVVPVSSLRPRIPVDPDVEHRAALTIAWLVPDKAAARELLDMLGLTDTETP